MKVADLTGPALDYAVALAMGFDIDPGTVERKGTMVWYGRPNIRSRFVLPQFSHAWDHGGPIVERGSVAVRRFNGKWYAMTSEDLGDGERAPWLLKTLRGVRYSPSAYEVKHRQCRFDHESILVAVCRCFAASILGEDIDIPKELL